MIVYASPADLSAWMGGTAPDGVVALLRTASLAVREATETAYYAADATTGLPTDATLLQAFNDATCAQAEALYTLEIDPAAGGATQTSVHASDKIGSAAIQYADTAEAVAAKQQVLGGLCLDAQRILRQSGIVLGVPWLVG